MRVTVDRAFPLRINVFLLNKKRGYVNICLIEQIQKFSSTNGHVDDATLRQRVFIPAYFKPFVLAP
jgi:hypothetical protein